MTVVVVRENHRKEISFCVFCEFVRESERERVRESVWVCVFVCVCAFRCVE